MPIALVVHYYIEAPVRYLYLIHRAAAIISLDSSTNKHIAGVHLANQIELAVFRTGWQRQCDVAGIEAEDDAVHQTQGRGCRYPSRPQSEAADVTLFYLDGMVTVIRVAVRTGGRHSAGFCVQTYIGLVVTP